MGVRQCIQDGTFPTETKIPLLALNMYGDRGSFPYGNCDGVVETIESKDSPTTNNIAAECISSGIICPKGWYRRDLGRM